VASYCKLIKLPVLPIGILIELAFTRGAGAKAVAAKPVVADMATTSKKVMILFIKRRGWFRC
jgi:hypothetical protein